MVYTLHLKKKHVRAHNFTTISTHEYSMFTIAEIGEQNSNATILNSAVIILTSLTSVLTPSCQ